MKIKTFSEFRSEILESFINILPHDEEKKKKHGQELFDLVHSAYASIGGIHGSGFKSPEDMSRNIKMIKFNRKEGKINAAAYYKDSNGRKRVAIATNRSPEGKSAIAKIMTDDLKQNRSYGESSGPSLKFLHDNMHKEDIVKHAIHPDTLKKLNPTETYQPVPEDDEHLKKFPHLKDYFYQRDIGGKLHTKVSLGYPGKRIE